MVKATDVDVALPPSSYTGDALLWWMDRNWRARLVREVGRKFQSVLPVDDVDDLWSRLLQYLWEHGERLAEFPSFDALYGWCRVRMYGAARRRLYDRRKARRPMGANGVRRTVSDFSALDDDELRRVAVMLTRDHDDESDPWEWSDRRLVECYADLPPVQRECIDAFVLAGLTSSEAGRVLGLRSSDVCNYVKRGLESLRRRYVGDYTGTRGRDFVPASPPGELGLSLWADSMEAA